jgi:hypothetical protein
MFYATGRNNVNYLEIKFNVNFLVILVVEKTRFTLPFHLLNYLP